MGVFVWSFMLIDEKEKQLCDINYFQLSMHCDLWPFDPKINRTHPQFMESCCIKLQDDSWKRKAIMQHKTFSVINALWPWPFDPEINRGHPLHMGSLCMKFHDDRCKGKAIMRHNLTIHWNNWEMVYLCSWYQTCAFLNFERFPFARVWHTSREHLLLRMPGSIPFLDLHTSMLYLLRQVFFPNLPWFSWFLISIIPWYFLDFTSIIPWYFLDFTSIIPWYFLDFTSIMPWYFLDFTSIIPWYFLDFTSIIPWYFLDFTSNDNLGGLSAKGNDSVYGWQNLLNTRMILLQAHLK